MKKKDKRDELLQKFEALEKKVIALKEQLETTTLETHNHYYNYPNYSQPYYPCPQLPLTPMCTTVTRGDSDNVTYTGGCGKTKTF